MKHLLTISLLVVITMTTFSCKKSDSPVVYPALQNTLWSGMFSFTSGDYTGPQPCTVTMQPDSTLLWTDAANQRPGGTWRTSNNRVMITQPNKIVFSATFTADKWTDFVNPSNSGFLIDSLTKAIPLQASALAGTTWIGQANSQAITLKFTSSTIVEVSYGGSLYNVPYTIDGGGLRFAYKTGLALASTAAYYSIANKDMTLLKGLETYTSVGIGGVKNFFFPFSLVKQ